MKKANKTRLIKLIKLLGLRPQDSLLTGSAARHFYPRDSRKCCHEVYFQSGKFVYFSASESHHNGDYYDRTTAVLPETAELISACIEVLTLKALDLMKLELEEEQHISLRRKASKRLESRL